MIDFTIFVAEIPIGISCFFESTKEYCSDYICEDMPVFFIKTSQEDLVHDRRQCIILDKKNGIVPKEYTDPFIEPLSVHRLLSDRLLEYNVALVHGSVVVKDNTAFLFAAPSGTGKTTHTRLWLKLFPDAYVLNGDKPFLKFANNEIIACGSPWMGKERFGCNKSVPLSSICFLERATTNHIETVSPQAAFSLMINSLYLPNDPITRLKALQLAGKLVNNVKLYHLGCNMDTEAAVVSSSAMLSGLNGES